MVHFCKSFFNNPNIVVVADVFGYADSHVEEGEPVDEFLDEFGSRPPEKWHFALKKFYNSLSKNFQM